MGNQILSFAQQSTNKQSQAHVTKSIIRPIKYGYKKSQAFQTSGNEHSGFLNKKQFEGQKSQIKLQDVFPFVKKNPEQFNRLEKQNHKMRMVKEQSEYYEDSYRKLQSIKSDFNLKNQNFSTSDMIRVDFRNPTESRSSHKGVQLSEQQIVINYLPVVSKMISILKPFQSQLTLLDETKIKKIRIGKQGDIYKGQLNDIRKPHGFGMIIKQNGSTLIGKFQNGLAQQYSVFIYSNGSYYKGKMLNSMANDSAGEFYSLKITYIGGFKENAFHGKCEQLGEDYYFKGEYENNLRKRGLFSWGVIEDQEKIKNENKLESNSKNDRKVQKYKENIFEQTQVPPVRNFKSLPQHNFTYEGEFDIHQLFTGKGKLKDPHGTYIGEFHRGMKQGKGQYQYNSQIKYIGDYEADQRSGYGVLMNYDNTIAYEGEWKNGLPNGKGYSYDLKGRKTESQFLDGLPSKILPL